MKRMPATLACTESSVDTINPLSAMARLAQASSLRVCLVGSIGPPQMDVTRILSLLGARWSVPISVAHAKRAHNATPLTSLRGRPEGKKTIAYEIAEQMGWRAPDVVVAPVAVGETFIAAHRGFAEMERLGFIPKRPLVAAAQAARANSITRAWRNKTTIAPLKIGYTVAEGLAAGNPRRKGDWVLRILRETGGVAGQARDGEILEAQKMLARSEGIWAGPTGSASLAVLARLLADKQVDPASTICVIVSETGLKTEARPPSRHATAFDEASLRRLVLEKLAAGA